MANYLSWLMAGVFLWKISHEAEKIIHKEAYVGYACALFIVALTLWEIVSKYG